MPIPFVSLLPARQLHAAEGARRPRATLLALTLAAALPGCGGGGGGASASGSGSGTPVPPPPPEAAYLVAGDLARQSADGVWRLHVYVFDPDHPAAGPVVETVLTPGEAGALDDTMAWVPATRADTAARSLSTLGQAAVVYLDQGALWRIDLRGGHDHQPHRLSMDAQVCHIDRAWALSASGDDAWVAVQPRAAVSGCDGRRVFYRMQLTASAPVAAIDPGVYRPVALPDGQGLFAGMVAARADGSDEVLGADRLLGRWAPVQAPAGAVPVARLAAGGVTDAVVADPQQAGQGWLMTASAVHALRWATAASPGVADGAPVQATAESVPLASPPIALSQLRGSAGGLLFSDGGVLRRWGRDGQVQRLASVDDGAWFATVLPLGDDVYFARRWLADPSPVDGQVWQWRGADAGLVDLSLGLALVQAADGSASAAGGVLFGLIGADAAGTHLLLQQAASVGSQAWQWVSLGPEGRAVVWPGAFAEVRSATRALGQPAPVTAVWSCGSAPSTGRLPQCEGGWLESSLDGAVQRQVPLAGGGPFQVDAWARVPVLEGLPQVVELIGRSGAINLWLLTPGGSGGLQPLTRF